MRRILSIVLFSGICSSFLLSQDIHRLKAYADEQYNRGNLTGALKEYQRILLFDSAHQYDAVYGNIADIYFETGDFENARIYYDFAGKAVAGDSLKLEFLFRKVLCHLEKEQYLLGLSDLYDMPDTGTPYFEAKKRLYLAICHFGLDELDQSLDYFTGVADSSGLERIDSLINALKEYEKKYDPDKLEMMSIFLPGLGQMVAGDVKNGLNSILLLGAIAAYSYHTMVVYGVLDGTLVMVTWFFRYYTGGHKKAYELGEEKIREQKRITYHRVMDIVGTPP